ncbi:hypothetical protein ColLi_03698 [Colletotrichum liriopes]|uniref:Uncharacterized protein n=1 Tax=Colletotrichum liriopes TaxID=708192 RepID=A0AA37LQQ2_9PEZI|nr:hypothetical protein ColLi_03698 [Colletotrichum liriopes]
MEMSRVLGNSLAVVVGEAEGSVAGAGADVVAVDEADASVGGLLEQQSRLAAVLGNDLVDGEAVDVPGLNGVAAGAVDGDGAHLDVGVGGLVAVEADADAAAEVHVDGAEGEVLGAVEAQAEVRVAGHGEVGDLDARGVSDLDGAAARAESDVDSSATLESLAATDGDGARADGAGGDDGDALAAGNGVDGSLDGGTVTWLDPLVATKELPEPVTLAWGVPLPHWAATEEASASTAVTRENLAMITSYLDGY